MKTLMRRNRWESGAEEGGFPNGDSLSLLGAKIASHLFIEGKGV